jgi:hypothetical protein
MMKELPGDGDEPEASTSNLAFSTTLTTRKYRNDFNDRLVATATKARLLTKRQLSYSQ